MNAGDAIFILQQHPDPVDSKGESIPVSHYGQVSEGKPMHIAIPQYAYYLHKGRKVRVIVVQAEKSKHETLVGARTLDGRDLSGPLAEFQLLGEHPPKRSAP